MKKWCGLWDFFVFCFWGRNCAWVPGNPKSVITKFLSPPPLFWTLLFLSPRKMSSVLKTLNPVALPILERFVQMVDVFSTQLSPEHLAWQVNWLAFSLCSPCNLLALSLVSSNWASYLLLAEVIYNTQITPPFLPDSSSSFIVFDPK